MSLVPEKLERKVRERRTRSTNAAKAHHRPDTPTLPVRCEKLEVAPRL